MNFISHIVSEPLINAIGWTILHSIWQGAAVALGFAVLMFLLRSYSSRTRYLIGVMALLLVLGISLATFFNVYVPGIVTNSAITTAGPTKSLLSEGIQSENFYRQGLFSGFTDYFNRHLPLIVTLWFLGILVLILKLAGGFLYNQRVKSYHTRTPDKSWQNHLHKLCRRIGIKQTVRLLESNLIKGPLTIGHFKPLILFPVGMVTGLPHDQVEALLAHELAHIQRKDYFVNIMQNIIDIFYFYHPGVRWISNYVRAERENCCDDIAVSISGDSINFARALSSIDGCAGKKINPALAVACKSSKLFGRIKRLFQPRRKVSEFTEGFVGAFVLVLFILTLVVSANAAAGLSRTVEESNKTNASTPAQAIYEDEKAEGKKKRKEEKETKSEAEEKAVKEEKAQREEKKRRQVEREKFAKMREEFRAQERELRQVQREKLAKIEVELRKKARELTRMEREKMEQLRITLRKMERELRKIDRKKLAQMEAELAKKVEVLTVADREKLAQMEKELEKQAQIMTTVNEKELAKMAQELEQRAEELQKLKTVEMEKMEEALAKKIEALKEKGIEFEKFEEEFEKHEKELAKHEEGLRKHEVFLHDLKKDLLQDKLIADVDDFEFKLTAKGLWVNGVKQSKKIFNKYKKIYESHTGKKLKDIKVFQVVNRK
jgi:beta-lactamase regulating signal transducer with metallopeptidase domain